MKIYKNQNISDYMVLGNRLYHEMAKFSKGLEIIYAACR
jgi:hypothetical protein